MPKVTTLHEVVLSPFTIKVFVRQKDLKSSRKKDTGSTKNLHRSGRPGKLSVEAKSFIEHQMRKKDEATRRLKVVTLSITFFSVMNVPCPFNSGGALVTEGLLSICKVSRKSSPVLSNSNNGKLSFAELKQHASEVKELQVLKTEFGKKTGCKSWGEAVERSVEEERRSHASAVLVEEDVFGENPPSSDAVMNATSRHACTANGS
ncbi:hypothetical protein P5673_020765 [Acropora cervicornis]|uniref:Uncharacterized protein n=1 Tax=Acropora cervicornis TaxID=6130 RepID=A0AAD9Q902_ACRCE|nr:hypothetical protein P5673_020765 [Acropora cervicornis]